MADVVVILGSSSDEKYFHDSKAEETFQACGVSYEVSYISAHRNPAELDSYLREVQRENAAFVFIAAAGMAAHLPGVIAGLTGGIAPVIGVPLEERSISSVLHMPPGRPVATMTIGAAGLTNAALLACQIIGRVNKRVEKALKEYQGGRGARPAQIRAIDWDPAKTHDS